MRDEKKERENERGRQSGKYKVLKMRFNNKNRNRNVKKKKNKQILKGERERLVHVRSLPSYLINLFVLSKCNPKKLIRNFKRKLLDQS